MTLYNGTTMEILRLLSKDDMTTDELAKALGCVRSNVTVPLLKLLKKDRVKRERVEQGAVTLKNPGKNTKALKRRNSVYVYGITDKGMERLSSIKNNG